MYTNTLACAFTSDPFPSHRERKREKGSKRIFTILLLPIFFPLHQLLLLLARIFKKKFLHSLAADKYEARFDNKNNGTHTHAEEERTKKFRRFCFSTA
jgi:hypothetical protein